VVLSVLALPVLGQNLVRNGDFEGGYRSAPGGEIANDWEWWSESAGNPIYGSFLAFWNRPVGGPGLSQRTISGAITSASCLGGIYQVVPIPPALRYTPLVLTFQYKCFGSTNLADGNEYAVYVDLRGGTNPPRTHPPGSGFLEVFFFGARHTNDQWQQVRFEFNPAGASAVTIWTRHRIFWPTITTHFDMDNVRLAPIAYRITGSVVLNDWGGDITAVSVEAQLRASGSTVPIRTVSLTLDNQGRYVIDEVVPGTYDVAFKASHWLRTVVRGVQVVNADVGGVNVALTNGDIDGDNEVTLFDFGQLVTAFGSMPGDSNWNPEADLDGDEEVTLFDFGVLVQNFGAIGDE